MRTASKEELEEETYVLDNELFVPAQNSVFNLLEMDSFQRFLTSEIYNNYRGT